MSIIRAKVNIKGTRTLLQCHFDPLTAIPTERKAKKEGAAGNTPEEWRDTCMIDDDDGQLYILPTYIMGCLRKGAKLTKKGRGTFQEDVSSAVQVEDEIVYLDRYVKDKDLLCSSTSLKPKGKAQNFIFVAAVVNPKTRARNIRYRLATVAGWECEFTINWEDTIISQPVMEQIIHDSGKFGGLGDGIKIGCGRFEVASIEVLEVIKRGSDEVSEDEEELEETTV